MLEVGCDGQFTSRWIKGETIQNPVITPVSWQMLGIPARNSDRPDCTFATFDLEIWRTRSRIFHKSGRIGWPSPWQTYCNSSNNLPSSDVTSSLVAPIFNLLRIGLNYTLSFYAHDICPDTGRNPKTHDYPGKYELNIRSTSSLYRQVT